MSGLDPNGAGALVVPGGVSTIAAADITDATATGIGLLTAADAAAARTAIGAGAASTRGSGTLAARPASPAAGDTYAVTSGDGLGGRYVSFVAGAWSSVAPDWYTYGASDLTLVQGDSSCAASLVSGRLRLTITTDSTRWYGSLSSVWQTTQGPHGWLALPGGVREVIVAYRVYSGSPPKDYGLSGIFLRNGTDPAIAPTAPTPATGGATLVGQSVWGHGAPRIGSFDAGWTSAGTGGLGEAWSATPGASIRWSGVRWTPGAVQAVACASPGTPALDDLLTYPTLAVAPAWGAPTMVVLALNRLAGGDSGTRTVDLDVVVYAR